MSENNTATVPAKPQAREVRVTTDESQFAAILDTAKFEHLWRVAKAFAASTLVPEHFQRNEANCFIGIQMAIRCGVDPFMFLQNCYIVHGRPGIEAKLAIAMANKSGVFADRIKWRMEGEGTNRKCTAYVTDQHGEVLEASVDWAMVQAEGWDTKKGSKWLTIPDMMFRYRSAMFLLRLYAPEVIMGMHSADELDDIPEHQASHTIDVLQDAPALGNEGLRSKLLTKKDVAEAVEPERQPQPEPAKPSGLLPDWTDEELLDGLKKRLAKCHSSREVDDIQDDFLKQVPYPELRDKIEEFCVNERFRIESQ